MQILVLLSFFSVLWCIIKWLILLAGIVSLVVGFITKSDNDNRRNSAGYRIGGILENHLGQYGYESYNRRLADDGSESVCFIAGAIGVVLGLVLLIFL